MARYAGKDETWPGWLDRKGLETYLQEKAPSLSLHFVEAWVEYERAIKEEQKY